ncbi:hypothetical protein ACK36H_20505, partial [Aeromonas veronii]
RPAGAHCKKSGAIQRRQVGRFSGAYHASDQLCPEQVMILNHLLDGYTQDGLPYISASQYQKIAQVSKSTATRHLTDLLEKKCLEKEPGGGGRNTRYRLKLTHDRSGNSK